MIRKAVAAEPDQPAYLDSLGWLLFRKGDFAGAVEQLEKAVALPGGQDPTLLSHLADAYEKAGKPGPARETRTKALDKARGETPIDEELVKALEGKLKNSPDGK